MTEVQTSPPKVIVVAEQAIYDLLRDSGAAWDVQHPVQSVGQMWDDLSGNRLDQHSVSIVFSDAAFAAPGELEAAISVMAPVATTFVVVWNQGDYDNLLDRVRQTATATGAPLAEPLPITPLYPSSKQHLLDTIRATFAAQQVPVAFPQTWAVDVNGAVASTADTDLTFEHSAPTAPVSAPVEPVAPVAQVAPVAPVAQVAPVAPVAQPYAPAAPVAPAPVGPVGQPGYTPDAVTPGEKQPLPGQVTMAVTSSKGGSGKSTTAMMLAAQIAQSSRLAYEAGLAERPLKVCLVDMDTRDGQVASLIGRYVPTALNIRVSPDWDEQTILSNLVHDPKLGIDALLAPVRPRTADDVGPDFYRHVIRTLKTTHDVVIMDTSVAYLDPLISTVCLPEATAILFVTTLATTSVQGMARALREITEPVEHGGMGIKRSKIGIVVNQSITEVGMDRDQVLQAALKVSIVGAIPLATKDVLTCTNFNKMHQLLKHPLLGPAYFKLAKTCMPHHGLSPVLTDSAPAPAPTGVPDAASAPAAVESTSAPEKKRLFGRKG